MPNYAQLYLTFLVCATNFRSACYAKSNAGIFRLALPVAEEGSEAVRQIPRDLRLRDERVQRVHQLPAGGSLRTNPLQPRSDMPAYLTFSADAQTQIADSTLVECLCLFSIPPYLELRLAHVHACDNGTDGTHDVGVYTGAQEHGEDEVYALRLRGVAAQVEFES
jgi:hypothetical protein